MKRKLQGDLFPAFCKVLQFTATDVALFYISKISFSETLMKSEFTPAIFFFSVHAWGVDNADLPNTERTNQVA